jgi:spermidine/putrescine transport system ATP-binding protein
MQLELKRIQEEVGITFIYVTHDQEEAMTMSDRLAVMRRGQIEQIGAPELVYESPATEFVAGFLGASNLLDGELVGNQSDVAMVRLTTGQDISIPASKVPSDIDTLVKVGVRPEKISIQADEGEPPAETNWVSGLLRIATYIGVSHQYKVEGPGGTELTVYVQNLGAEEAPAPGRKVRLTWRPEHTFIVKPSEALTPEEVEE